MKLSLIQGILVILALCIIPGCEKSESNNSTDFINASVDGAQYNCATSIATPSFSNGKYSATYWTASQKPYYGFNLSIHDYSLLSGVTLPYTFPGNYNGAGIQIYFYYRGNTTVNDFDFFANNWSQAVSSTSFKAIITKISNGTIEGTFQGYFRWYDTQSNPPGAYLQKNIQNGIFSLPYNP